MSVDLVPDPPPRRYRLFYEVDVAVPAKTRDVDMLARIAMALEATGLVTKVNPVVYDVLDAPQLALDQAVAERNAWIKSTFGSDAFLDGEA